MSLPAPSHVLLVVPSTALVWFRRDLRVHDHPPLTAALGAHDRVAPVFVFDDVLLQGRFPSPTRAAFLRECLAELDAALRERGGGLVFRAGAPERELPALAQEAGAAAVYWAGDVSPYAHGRDERVAGALRDAGVEPVRTPGLFVADVSQPRTQSGKPFTVFTPFWKSWEKLERREVHGAPRAIALPPGLRKGRLPAAETLGAATEVAEPLPAGEAAARSAMHAWLEDGIAHYADQQDRFAQGSSMLSPYLHFGCLSPRELEARVGELRGKGPAAYARQLAWRDFYAHVLLRNPGNARHEFQERYRDLEWDEDPVLLEAWTEGRTGYPLVDAGMRQLKTIGWMHNRARLVVGSFLTKDLHLDWRHGEAHFMRYLLDGDEASNNGNWQ